jgi:serine phosphatase RsbU (regulator of sigma subunit)/CBS domain-containing protein
MIREGQALAEDTDQSNARDVMASRPLSAPPDTPVGEVARLMGEHNVGAVVVCRDEAVIGIFTERDLLRLSSLRHQWNVTSVSSVMTGNPFTISADEPWTVGFEIMAENRIRHLPVVDQGRLVGMLSVRDLMEHRTRHLEQLVGQRTAELELKSRDLHERDKVMQLHLELAGKIQRQLLPAGPPEVPSLSFAVAYCPRERVSGDYYDFTTLPNGRVGILIADACGHGIPAALVSVMAKTAFQAYARGIDSPAAVLTIMNDRLGQLIEADHFMTMLYGVMDQGTLSFTYSMAGHPPPLWYRRGIRSVEALKAEGAMIGLMPRPSFEERSIELGRGDCLLLYTDGVIDCCNPGGDAFGQDRLADFLSQHSALPIAVAIEQLEAELTCFHGRRPFADDVTCIGLSVKS